VSGGDHGQCGGAGKDGPNAAEGYRVLWTWCGVAIGVFVMFLASLLARHTAEAPPHPATQPA
jgi:hypothetical protein